MKNLLFYIITFLIFANVFAQTENENWVEVDNDYGSELFINTVGLEKYTGDDLYVWAFEENDPPVTLEGIEEKIYSTKTLYFINKSIRKYSLAKIIYYNEDGMILQQYSYDIVDALPQYKYSYPIYGGSDVDFILAKSLEYIGNSDEK